MWGACQTMSWPEAVAVFAKCGTDVSDKLDLKATDDKFI